jgi:prepilin-type processing-associated H-X9-DG protein
LDINPSNTPKDKTKLSQVNDPAQIFVLADEDEASINDGCLLVDSDKFEPPHQWSDMPSSRHNQTCNVFYADAHSQPNNRRWPKARKSQPQSPINPEIMTTFTGCLGLPLLSAVEQSPRTKQMHSKPIETTNSSRITWASASRVISELALTSFTRVTHTRLPDRKTKGCPSLNRFKGSKVRPLFDRLYSLRRLVFRYKSQIENYRRPCSTCLPHHASIRFALRFCFVFFPIALGIFRCAPVEAQMTLASGKSPLQMRRLNVPGWPIFHRDDPYTMSLVEGIDGTLYGTVTFNPPQPPFEAHAFRLNKDGSGYSKLHAWPRYAESGLDMIAGTDGFLYGLTAFGGLTNSDWKDGFGTLFKMASDGSSYLELHQFAADGRDGWWPASLIQGHDGVLYGTTLNGGIATPDSPDGAGTIFRINPDGSEYRVVYSFSGALDTDGKAPRGLVHSRDGKLYACSSAGLTNIIHGGGIVFSIERDGSNFSTLHEFAGGADGLQPWLSLYESADGTIFGTTANGGSTNFDMDNCCCFGAKWGSGTIYSLAPGDRAYQVIHRFSAVPDCSDAPPMRLTEMQGLLYGLAGHRLVVMRATGLDYSTWAQIPGVGPATPAGGVFPAMLTGRDNALYVASYAGVFAIRPDSSGTPRLSLPVPSVDDTVVLGLVAQVGTTNQVQRTDTIGQNWRTLTNLVTPLSGYIEINDSTSLPHAFYRGITK